MFFSAILFYILSFADTLLTGSEMAYEMIRTSWHGNACHVNDHYRVWEVSRHSFLGYVGDLKRSRRTMLINTWSWRAVNFRGRPADLRAPHSLSPGVVSGQLTQLFSWWRLQMETFSALLVICAGSSPVPGEVPAKRPVTRSFDVFFYLRLNKRLSKQSWGWRFETLSRPLWRQCNGWRAYV